VKKLWSAIEGKREGFERCWEESFIRLGEWFDFENDIVSGFSNYYLTLSRRLPLEPLPVTF
jgi:hypothetical protein